MKHGRIEGHAFGSATQAITYAATLTFNVSVHADYEVGVLTGNLAITLTNGTDGCSGTVIVKQDGTGSRTVSFAASGRTVLRDSNTADLLASTGANTITMYAYDYVTLGGTAYLFIAKSFLV